MYTSCGCYSSGWCLFGSKLPIGPIGGIWLKKCGIPSSETHLQPSTADGHVDVSLEQSLGKCKKLVVQYAKQSSTLRMFVLSVVMETIVSKVHVSTLTSCPPPDHNINLVYRR